MSTHRTIAFVSPTRSFHLRACDAPRALRRWKPSVWNGVMARMNDDDLLELAPGAPLRGTAYLVTKKLGAGGMGAVYEGEHVRISVV